MHYIRYMSFQARRNKPLPAPVARALPDTGVALPLLRRLGANLSTLPAALEPHRVVAKLYEQRAAMIASGEAIDWALAEQLAWASLMCEGVHVRLSGQDVERGTFSHRHAVVHDQKDFGRKYVPLQHVEGAQAAVTWRYMTVTWRRGIAGDRRSAVTTCNGM